jgi:hypothetical protein
MPTENRIATGVEEILCDASPERTLILVVNTDAANQLYVSDSPGVAAALGGIVIPVGGNLEMSRRNGYNTENNWYVYALALTTFSLAQNFQRNGTVTERAMPYELTIPQRPGWV